MKNKYQVLKEILDDYLFHMEEVNNQRVEASARDMEYIMKELGLFNLLKNNLEKIYQGDDDGILQNQ